MTAPVENHRTRAYNAPVSPLETAPVRITMRRGADVDLSEPMLLTAAKEHAARMTADGWQYIGMTAASEVPSC